MPSCARILVRWVAVSSPSVWGNFVSLCPSRLTRNYPPVCSYIKWNQWGSSSRKIGSAVTQRGSNRWSSLAGHSVLAFSLSPSRHSLIFQEGVEGAASHHGVGKGQRGIKEESSKVLSQSEIANWLLPSACIVWNFAEISRNYCWKSGEKRWKVPMARGDEFERMKDAKCVAVGGWKGMETAGLKCALITFNVHVAETVAERINVFWATTPYPTGKD